MIIQAIPLSELLQLVRAFRAQSEANAARCIKEMHDTGNGELATGYAGASGAYELCARALESMLAEWTVAAPTFPLDEVQL